MLGPVTIVDRGAIHDVGIPRHRAVITALALRRRTSVSTSELFDALWGDGPPASADKTLQGYVSALRKRFGEEVIETVPGGYRIGPAVESVDADDFAALVTAGRRSLTADDVAGARRELTAALALWRGEPCVDLAPGAFRTGHRARLDELRVLAQEGRAEAELALGHHHDVIPDLEQLVSEHPYREPLWRSLMLAHYRAGSAGAALGVAQRLREVLREDLGIDPAAESLALEARILDHDRSLDLVRRSIGNVPVPLDSFVGRVDEQAALADLVRRHRLVTVVGVGGVGKSRLANEVARTTSPERPGGTWWIDLAAIPPSASVLGHVLAAMELPVQTTSSPEEVLLARLRGGPTLLVLDNCEHECERTAAFVGWVTSHDTGVGILATSRVPLSVHGEQLVQLGPLPTDGDDCDSIRLFLDRAAARGRGESSEVAEVAEIVRAVDGLPLGVELAAAQCAVRSTGEIARRLRDRHELLDLSASGDDDRHHRLRDVLDDTIGVLSPDAADALPLLAVFPGDFGLDAAAAVLGVDAGGAATMMSHFLDASLVIVSSERTTGRRFRMLWPVRELLLERSNRPATTSATPRFAEHFRQVAREFLDVADRPDEIRWIERHRIEDHNLRLALGWWEANDATTALEFGPGLGRAWMLRGDQDEGRDVLQRLLANATDAPSRLIAATETGLGTIELLTGDPASALAIGADAIARFEALDDARWLSRALRQQAHALHLGGFASEVTDPVYQRSLDVARDAHLTYSQALTEVHFAHAAGANEELDRAEAMLDHAETVLRRHADHGALAHAGLGRVFVAYGRRDAVGCRRAAEEMMRQARLDADTIWVQVAAVVLGLTWCELGDEDRSHRYFRDAVHLAHDSANATQLGIALHAVAATAADRHPSEAARLWGAAGSFTPLWPLHAHRYGELMEQARSALGADFEGVVETGRTLSVDDAVRLADTIL